MNVALKHTERIPEDLKLQEDFKQNFTFEWVQVDTSGFTQIDHSETLNFSDGKWLEP